MKAREFKWLKNEITINQVDDSQRFEKIFMLLNEIGSNLDGFKSEFNSGMSGLRSDIGDFGGMSTGLSRSIGKLETAPAHGARGRNNDNWNFKHRIGRF